MKNNSFTFSLLGIFFAGVSLCSSSAQGLPAPSLPAPEEGINASDTPAPPPSEAIPLNAPPASSSEESSPTEEGELPPGMAAAPATMPKAATDSERSSMILMKIRDNDRAVDPFGLPMDPGGRPGGSILADQYEEIVEDREVSETSLSSALMQLSLTGAYPAEQKVVVGPRSFKMGEMFGMRFGELTLRLRFEGIKGQKVYFRDMDTKELAYLDFNTTPKEFEPMFKNSKLSTPEGINPMSGIFIVN